MPEIFVLQSRLIKGLEEWETCWEHMAGLKGRVSGIRSGMRQKVRSKNKIGQQLVEICSQLESLCRDANQLGQVLETVTGCYITAEQRLEGCARELSSGIWDENRLLGQAAALAPGHGSRPSSEIQKKAHTIVEKQGPVRMEWAGWEWRKEGTAMGLPAGFVLNGSLWGGEWEEEDVKTAGEDASFGWKGTQTGWLARGEAMGYLGDSSFAGSAAVLFWEESLQADLEWDLTEKRLPKLAVEGGISLSGVELHGEEKSGSYFSEMSGSLGYANAGASLKAGLDETEHFSMQQQVSMEAGAFMGEAKGGFEFWGITCAVGLQGSVGAVGYHGGYELTEQSAEMNVGTALGVGCGIDVEVDWSEAGLPETRETLERGKRRSRKRRGKRETGERGR